MTLSQGGRVLTVYGLILGHVLRKDFAQLGDEEALEFLSVIKKKTKTSEYEIQINNTVGGEIFLPKVILGKLRLCPFYNLYICLLKYNQCKGYKTLFNSSDDNLPDPDPGAYRHGVDLSFDLLVSRQSSFQTFLGVKLRVPTLVDVSVNRRYIISLGNLIRNNPYYLFPSGRLFACTLFSKNS